MDQKESNRKVKLNSIDIWRNTLLTEQIDFWLILVVLFVVTLGIDVLGNFISKHFSPLGERMTSIYQGGERMPATERRYETESFYYTFFFMILHVLGFFAATLMVLNLLEISPLNFTTITFGFFSFYAIFLIRKLSTR